MEFLILAGKIFVAWSLVSLFTAWVLSGIAKAIGPASITTHEGPDAS